MEYHTLKKIIIEDRFSKQLTPIKSFLKNQGLKFDKSIEYTVAIYDGEKVIGTGSFDNKVLKCIAIDKNYRGMGISNKILSDLINEEYRRGNSHLFIYTKPKNYSIFSDLGFYKIEEVENKVILLENRPDGIEKFLQKISKSRINGKIVSALVMNCNPFTLGHKYLIEKASKESDIVHVFIVWENKSEFPNDIRYKLVKKGIEHLDNVILHKGEDYIISSATFPSYFIKDKSEVSSIHSLLDVKIFGEYIAPVLGINKRYIGDEPLSNVTRNYNEVMKKTLPHYGVDVIEVHRICKDGEIISASNVRSLIKENKFDEIRNLVPDVTYEFLISDSAKLIINNIKNS